MVTLNQLSRGVGHEGGLGKGCRGSEQVTGSLCWDQPLCSSRGPLGPGVNLKDRGVVTLGELVFQAPRVLFLRPQRAPDSPHSVLEQGRGLGTNIVQPDVSKIRIHLLGLPARRSALDWTA